MHGKWLYQDKKLRMDSGYMKTLFMYGQWLYLNIVYVLTVVISRHCSCIDRGYIKKLFMYEQ
jgi:phage-related holin